MKNDTKRYTMFRFDLKNYQSDIQCSKQTITPYSDGLLAEYWDKYNEKIWETFTPFCIFDDLIQLSYCQYYGENYSKFL